MSDDDDEIVLTRAEATFLGSLLRVGFEGDPDSAISVWLSAFIRVFGSDLEKIALFQRKLERMARWADEDGRL